MSGKKDAAKVPLTNKDYFESKKKELGENGKLPDEVWEKMSPSEKKKFARGQNNSKPKKPKSVHPNHAHSFQDIGEKCVQLFEMVQRAANHGGANGLSKSAKREKQAVKREKQAAKQEKDEVLNEIRQTKYFPAETALMELCVPKPYVGRTSVDSEVLDAWKELKDAYKQLRSKRVPHEEEDDYIDQRMKLVTTAMGEVGDTRGIPQQLTKNVNFQKFFELAFTRSFYKLFECYEEKGTDDDHRTVIKTADLEIYDEILTKIKILTESEDTADGEFKDKFQWINDRHITGNMDYMRRGEEVKQNDDKNNRDVKKLLNGVFDKDKNTLEAFHEVMCASRAPFASKQSSKKADDEVTSLIDQIRAELGGGGAKK